ncbi:PREDICTED: uncharacterized protein LOC106818663 [Priapulus caudatus]|uniref:Uncharacterized protein LOC106818663 n=1 Tax=Priapulus caudatus TaxID=37621 RepID=A0ABM1F315_PRICU|nr:PREDICTED: uncharacterized protein LOC106818663 [Priapulus caudatus]
MEPVAMVTSAVTIHFLCSDNDCDDTMTSSDQLMTVFTGIIFPIFCGVNIVGNSINVGVFTRMGAGPCRLLLRALAVAEATHGACFLAQKLLLAYCGATCVPCLVIGAEKVGDLAFYTANYIVVGVSVFRCIAIVAPLRMRVLCTLERARHVIVASAICAAVKEIPYWVRIVYPYDPTLRVLEPINQTLGRLLPCAAVAATTGVAVVSYRRLRGQLGVALRQRRRHRADDHVVRMLLVLLAIFVVTNVYCAALILLRIYDVQAVAPLLFTEPIAIGVNSCVNFFLYVAMMPDYRAALRASAPLLLAYVPVGHAWSENLRAAN